VLNFLKKENCIIALGGGVFLNDRIRDSIFKNCISIWLDGDIETLEKRVKWNERRPLLKINNNYKMIKKIYLERKKICKLAHHKIKCDKVNKSDIVEKIIALYEQQ
jgi:Shikimate kinase